MTLRTTVHCLIIAALARKHDDQYNKRLTDSEEGRNFGNHKVLKSFLMESGPTEHFRALSALSGPKATSIALPYFYPSNIICRSLPAALPPWSTLLTRTSTTDHITPALQQAFSQNQHGNLAPHSQGHSKARLSTVRSFTPSGSLSLSDIRNIKLVLIFKSRLAPIFATTGLLSPIPGSDAHLSFLSRVDLSPFQF